MPQASGPWITNSESEAISKAKYGGNRFMWPYNNLKRSHCLERPWRLQSVVEVGIRTDCFVMVWRRITLAEHVAMESARSCTDLPFAHVGRTCELQSWASISRIGCRIGPIPT
eukprot:6453048-Amphidinium_carterae.2